MRNIVVYDMNDNVYKRISKKKARTLYNNGKEVVICAKNLQPFGMWHCGSYINKYHHGDFDKVVDRYEIYNCTNNVCGYYASFYECVSKARG